MSNFRQFTLSRRQMLQRLEQMAPEAPLLSIHLRSGAARAEIEGALLSCFDRGDLSDALAERALASPSGAAIYYGGGMASLILPPFPLTASLCERRFNPQPLQAMLDRDWRIALILVRLGQFAVAFFRGEELVAHKAGTGLVHARHHKGGSSANRFARHRGKQMESFFTRLEGHARELLEPRLREIDYLFYGGTRDTVQALLRQCDFFKRLEEKRVPRMLNVREPKYSTLAEALQQVYACRLYEYQA